MHVPVWHIRTPLRHAMLAIIEFAWTCCFFTPFFSLTLTQMSHSGSPFSLPLGYLTLTSSLGLGFNSGKLLTLTSCSVLCPNPSPFVHTCTLSRPALTFCICGLAVFLSIRLFLYLAEHSTCCLVCAPWADVDSTAVLVVNNIRATRKL